MTRKIKALAVVFGVLIAGAYLLHLIINISLHALYLLLTIK